MEKIKKKLFTLKNIFYVIAIPVLLASIFFLVMIAPSADLNDYKAYRFSTAPNDSIPEGKVKVTFLGTTTLLIDDGETQLLTDGFVTRPGVLDIFFGKMGCDTGIVKSVIRQQSMTRLKAVFTCHSHYDHAMDAPYMVKYTGANLYGSKSTLNIGRGAGLLENRMELYQPGKQLNIGKFTITIINSKHTPELKSLGMKIRSDVGSAIAEPLHQPAKRAEYMEGGTYDILVQHGQYRILIKASTNFIPGALDNVTANILFLGVATLSKQNIIFQNEYYDQTVGKVHPQIVIPIHWDDFTKPLCDNLKPLPKVADNVQTDFDFLVRKTKINNIQFRIMQGYESVMLF